MVRIDLSLWSNLDVLQAGQVAEVFSESKAIVLHRSPEPSIAAKQKQGWGGGV